MSEQCSKNCFLCNVGSLSLLLVTTGTTAESQHSSQFAVQIYRLNAYRIVYQAVP